MHSTFPISGDSFSLVYFQLTQETNRSRERKNVGEYIKQEEEENLEHISELADGDEEQRPLLTTALCSR